MVRGVLLLGEGAERLLRLRLRRFCCCCFESLLGLLFVLLEEAEVVVRLTKCRRTGTTTSRAESRIGLALDANNKRVDGSPCLCFLLWMLLPGASVAVAVSFSSPSSSSRCDGNSSRVVVERSEQNSAKEQEGADCCVVGAAFALPQRHRPWITFLRRRRSCSEHAHGSGCYDAMGG